MLLQEPSCVGLALKSNGFVPHGPADIAPDYVIGLPVRKSGLKIEALDIDRFHVTLAFGPIVFRHHEVIDVLLPTREKILRLRMVATPPKELKVLLQIMKILLPNKPKFIENVVTKMA
jgi:hypothetical protein